MTQNEFNSTNWHRGNVVKLLNGKEYLVKGVKGHGKYLLLYSYEYDARFVADYRIVDCRTSDYEEPEEVYLEHKRMKQAEAEAKREAERQERLREKVERKLRNKEEQERIHNEAVARKAALKRNKELARKKAMELEAEASKPTKTAAPEKQKVEKPAAKKPTVEKTVAEKPVTEKPVAESPVAEEPKKRIRKRIRISSAIPVNFNK